MLPGTAFDPLFGGKLYPSGITLCLPKPARHVFHLALGLDHAKATSVDEQRIIDRTAFGRPFRNGDRLAGLRPCSGRMA